MYADPGVEVEVDDLIEIDQIVGVAQPISDYHSVVKKGDFTNNRKNLP
jgi:hypothetical protein